MTGRPAAVATGVPVAVLQADETVEVRDVEDTFGVGTFDGDCAGGFDEDRAGVDGLAGGGGTAIDLQVP